MSKLKDNLKKKIVSFLCSCARAELHVEVVDLADEDRTKVLEELEGYTIISMRAQTLTAYKTDKSELLKAELTELLAKGWVWSDS